MFSSWIFHVIVFIVLQIVFLQTFKYATKHSRSIGALTVVIQIIAAVSVMIFAPFFDWNWPSGGQWLPWVLLFLSFVCFAVNDRLDAQTRKNLDITVDTMLHQVYRLLFFPCLILFLPGGGTFRWVSLVAGIIIVLANMMLIFNKGKFQFNRYVFLKLFSVVFFTAAITLQLRSLAEGDFNLPFFTLMSFGIPAIFLMGVRQAGSKTLVREMKRKEWWIILICGVAQGIWTLSWYYALQIGRAEGAQVEVQAITAVYVLLNVVFAYIFLRERNNLAIKIISGIIIVMCIAAIATARIDSAVTITVSVVIFAVSIVTMLLTVLAVYLERPKKVEDVLLPEQTAELGDQVE
jgi:uncharacterized membrane protein